MQLALNLGFFHEGITDHFLKELDEIYRNSCPFGGNQVCPLSEKIDLGSFVEVQSIKFRHCPPPKKRGGKNVYPLDFL